MELQLIWKKPTVKLTYLYLNMKIKITCLFLFWSLFVFSQIKTSYVIKDITELTGEMYVNVKQISTNICRKNAAGTQIILKFEGATPIIFKNDTIYTHVEIHEELAKEEWVGYSGGLEIVGEFFITDYRYKDDMTIKINEWMYITPFELKDSLWAIPYNLYLKYKVTIDSNVNLYKFVIRNVQKNEFIELRE